MIIAVDAMGGDHAPVETVKGAIRAVESRDISIILVGDQEAVERELAKLPSAPKGRIQVKHASEIVQMDEHPANAIRRKTDSSIVVAASLVAGGQAQAMVSAGNTGAAMAVAAIKLGRIEGIDRPAIGALIPTATGRAVMLDGGANVDCSVENLVQFAVMGKEYAERVLNIENPRVGLLSIGEEATKGNELTKAANARLSRMPLKFVGNVDGKDVFRGAADVIVCDGFAGNLVLKIAEGMAEFAVANVKAEIERSPIYRLGAWLCLPAFRRVKMKIDYAEYGGAPLLGVNGVCIISHGRSNALAISNAIRAAAAAVENDVVGCITASVRREEMAAI
jgi:glycerol-3-phosphate acyltransferase PlsX